jgi:site-specific recombinase XerD
VARTQRVTFGSGVTWTVVDEGHHVVAAIEQYLEFLRNGGYSSNTVKAYSRALALWWTFLERKRLGWADVELRHFGEFLRELRMDSVETGVVSFETGVVSFDEPQMVPDGTVANRMRAVMSFYRYHASHGVTVASMLYEQVRAHPGPYLPFLEHVSRRNGRARARLRIRSPRSSTPILTPQQLGVLLDHEASWDLDRHEWVGDLRYRLLWSFLAETGARLGEALSLRHRDWCTGRGGTASVRFPHGQTLKSGPRRVHVGSALDRLYGDYVWMLCERGADLGVQDWDSSYVFVNTTREPLFAPMRPESIYAHLRALKRRSLGLPEAMTPHWFRRAAARERSGKVAAAHAVRTQSGPSPAGNGLKTYRKFSPPARASGQDWTTGRLDDWTTGRLDDWTTGLGIGKPSLVQSQ